MHKVLNFLTVLFAFSFIALKLNASGVITTVAGDLLPGNENAATATLIFPAGIAVDNQGNVYIVDNYTEKVKKLDPNGNLTDLGVPDLSQPCGVVADTSGNIYISDTGHGLIKQRDSLGIITTIAGDGGTANRKYLGPISAAGVSLISPLGLALDQSGNLYIADKSNSSIRKLQLGSNLISTLAGRAGTIAGRNTTFSGDGGQAIDADLQYSFGVAVDSVRNVIYIADTFNHRIRKVDSLGVITTVAGSISGYGAEPVNDPLGDTCPQGYRGDGGPATSAMLDTPTGLAVDSAGNLYIADTGNCVIRKVDTNGIITTVAGTIPLLNGTNPINTFAQSGYSGDGGPATSAKLNAPYAIACDSAGNLYIADTGNARIRKVTFASAPTITTPTSASVGSTTATLGGNVTGTGGASLTAVGVVYSVTSTNSNPQLSGTGVTNVTSTAATGVFTVNATALSAGTAYSYAAYATNSQGTTYTSVGTFTTTVPTPTLTFTTPSTASVAVGATRTNAVTSTLSGGSYGAITYTSSQTSKATVNATTGVVTGLAVGTTTITATQAAASGFNATTSTSYTLTVTIGTPTITTAPTASGITYGQTLASSTLSGGTASVVGTFAFTTPSTAPGVGTAAQGVTFTPTDTTNYTSTTTTVNVTVAKATPTISAAPTASGITYGQTLASSTLSGGTASTAGTFTFTTTSTAPNAGTAAQGVTFTPSSTINYNAVTTTVNVTVAKATPTVTWATPSAITYGTALSATQLNATGSVAGTTVYSPASGTTPSAGTQTLTATFTPTDTANYNTATRTVSLVVGKATPTLTWATPSAITYGTALSATQLNATANVAGAIAYSPSTGTTPSAGTQTLTATFTPTDTA
ncbi:MAG: Ig-like domain-containing protein, partial [Opitutaceae bacterium]